MSQCQREHRRPKPLGRTRGLEEGSGAAGMEGAQEEARTMAGCNKGAELKEQRRTRRGRA